MAAYDVSVNVVFFGGADFASPPPLGDTDRSRYVKVRTLEEAKAAEMTAWIKQAARVPGWNRRDRVETLENQRATSLTRSYLDPRLRALASRRRFPVAVGDLTRTSQPARDAKSNRERSPVQ